MIRRKPLIAVTGPDKGGLTAWVFTWVAVKRAGGKPVRITPSKAKQLPDFDGLIIGGGADINPELYDAEPLKDLKDLATKEKSITGFRRFLHLTVGIFIVAFRKIFSLGHTAPIDSDRDELEKKILKKAIDTNKPVLGICRGMQFINVHFGGRLHQQITEFYGEIPKVDTIYPKKEINIEPDSKLAEILGTQTARVNSLHNQAVNEPGEHILISAKEKTDVIQALEHTERPFIIGIQWHPEYLPQVKLQQRLFKRLVNVASEKSN